MRGTGRGGRALEKEEVTCTEVRCREKYISVFPVPEGETVVQLRKFMLSTDTWKEEALPVESVSTDSKKPLNETYMLLDGIGFFVLYLVELK